MITINMEQISQQQRTALQQKTQWGDIERASRIYAERYGKSIAPNYLTKFLTGYREGSAKIPRKHHPLDMYAAIVMAVAERQEKTSETNRKADELRKLIDTIHNDTTQTLAQ